MVPTAAIETALSLIDPAFELREANPIERGVSSVHRLSVDTPDGPRTYVFKASPEDEWGIRVDARLLGVLDAHTDLPVPTVAGAIDDHPVAPAPCYLMTEIGGEDLGYERVGWLADDALRRLARETGRHLGRLHGLGAVDSFGLVSAAGPALSGDRPSGAFDTVAVEGGYDEPGGFVAAWTGKELDRHADGRFAGLTGRLRSWFDDELADLEAPDEPVLTRNDHGLHNLRPDPDTGAVRGMLDWAYTLAAPPAFDLGYATYIYGGAYLAGLPDVEDRSGLVRAAVHEGYRSTAPERFAGATRRAGPYELLAAVRVMNDFDHLVPHLPDGADVEAVAARIEIDVAATIADHG